MQISNGFRNFELYAASDYLFVQETKDRHVYCSVSPANLGGGNEIKFWCAKTWKGKEIKENFKLILLRDGILQQRHNIMLLNSKISNASNICFLWNIWKEFTPS